MNPFHPAHRLQQVRFPSAGRTAAHLHAGHCPGTAENSRAAGSVGPVGVVACFQPGNGGQRSIQHAPSSSGSQTAAGPAQRKGGKKQAAPIRGAAIRGSAKGETASILAVSVNIGSQRPAGFSGGKICRTLTPLCGVGCADHLTGGQGRCQGGLIVPVPFCWGLPILQQVQDERIEYLTTERNGFSFTAAAGPPRPFPPRQSAFRRS